ncbi:reverse transcriptase [Plakobranchus ocellatus]|uniref:Reverse transcriptase n=1 Tax=Plakobranchus ocellatus TaxID=259542 RepID=A0AAV3YCR6_9GAST|nr:reverse transcriptase [Plakobranchus ocellatus]
MTSRVASSVGLCLVYDICSITVEAIEAKIKKYTRKWLGVPPGLSDVAKYCRKAKLKLSMKSILEKRNERLTGPGFVEPSISTDSQPTWIPFFAKETRVFPNILPQTESTLEATRLVIADESDCVALASAHTGGNSSHVQQYMF